MPSQEELLNQMMSDQEAPSSALALVGLGGAGSMGYSGDDLLDEALKGNIAAPTAHPTLEDKPKPGFSHLRDSFEQEPAEPSEPQEPEVPAIFHSLNDRLEQQRASEDKRWEEQKRRDEAFIQHLQQQQRLAQQQAHQQAEQQDDLYQHFGLESPDALNVLESRILAKYHQQTAPIIVNLAYERFKNAIHQAAGENEHFGKYFSVEGLTPTFNHVLQTRPLQETMSIDWSKEFKNAYAAADAPRSSQEVAALRKEIEQLKAGKAQPDRKEEKKQQSANLHLVGKANQQGKRPAAKAVGDEFDTKGGMRALSRQIKSKYGL